MTLRVKNWSEFQHYRDRKPAWIKLHRELLDNYDWHRLPDASRALAPMLWLLASESEDGTVTGTVDEIAFRLRSSVQSIEAGLKPLISSGFFILDQGAITPLAEAEHVAIPEEEGEREEQVKKEEEGDTPNGAVACATAEDVTTGFAMFNQAAKRTGWPEAQKIDDDRKKLMRARLKDVGGLEGFAIALGKAEASEFLTATWPNFNLDWMLKPKNFRKLMEGNYANRSSMNGAPAGKMATLDKVIKRFEAAEKH